ncbi:MAG: pantoate--beta-alanine ligase [Nitrospirota bacterium]
MEVIRIPRVMQNSVIGCLRRGKTIGLVPTMGALHDGHLSLARRARHENDITVVSIFVNPIQFGPSEDFQRYPRDIEGDTEKLAREEVDVLFLPDASLMYPAGFSTYIDVENVSEGLCGALRPGHFRGVATVVTKLFNLVKPTRAYFGQKDFQQTVVIRRLARDLDMDIEVVICPTVRERDGLAMSSRNSYLGKEEREAATILYRSLKEASVLINSGIIQADILKKAMQDMLRKEPAVSAIDYAGVYDPESLRELSEIHRDVLLAIAARIGNTRLIDNMLVSARKER